MARKQQRGRRRLFTSRPRRAAFSDSNIFYSEYLPLTIIPPASKPKRTVPLMMTVSALIVVGAALIFVFAR